jgi:hypothetical protein
MGQRAVSVSALALVLVVPLVGAGGADAAAPKVRVKVLARGLDSPRGLAVASNGDLYLAQAGKGGAGPCFIGAEGPTCLGATGKISKIQGTTLSDVVTGLPSLGLQGSGDNAIGPTDVSFNRGRLYATFGLAADPDVRTRATTPNPPGGLGGSALARRLATLNRITTKPGKARQLADIGAFEKARNPDRAAIDTNPNSVVANKNSRVVVDAGGNSLLRVRSNGTVRTLAVFPDEAAVTNPGGTPPTIAPQAVPDSVVRGPDGAYYVGQLTGFPFVKGTATVFRVVPGKAPRVYADGFTNIIDLAFDRNGDLLVLEIARNGLFGPLITQNNAWEGALIRVRKSGGTVKRKTLLTKPLFAPGGITVDGRNIYVSNRSVFAGRGQILRLRVG